MTAYMRDVDWDNPTSPIENFRGYLNIVSKENELEAWILLAGIATKILKDFPSTLTEDEEVLEKDRQ